MTVITSQTGHRLACLGVFLAALNLTQCSRNSPRNPQGSPSAAEAATGAIPGNEFAVQEEELAELERQRKLALEEIGNKRVLLVQSAEDDRGRIHDELKGLRLKADALHDKITALRTQIADAKAHKVYNSPQELFSDMPKDAYPESGADAGLERAEAEKWCKSNLIGRTIEWTGTVTHIENPQHDASTVEMFVDRPPHPLLMYVRPMRCGPQFPLGHASCQMYISDEDNRDMMSPCAHFRGCTSTEVKALRKKMNEKVTLRAKITDVRIDDVSPPAELPDELRQFVDHEGIHIYLQTSTIVIDGFVPEATRQKTERLGALAVDPESTLLATDQLIAQGAIEQAAAKLAELRDALEGSSQSKLANDHARKLFQQHPNHFTLHTELRLRGFVLEREADLPM